MNILYIIFGSIIYVFLILLVAQFIKNGNPRERRGRKPRKRDCNHKWFYLNESKYRRCKLCNLEQIKWFNVKENSSEYVNCTMVQND